MEVKLIVPDSLAEVTLGQYQNYLEATKDMDELEDAHEMNKKLIEAFCGIEYELVDSIPIMDIEKLLETLKMAFERDYELTTRFELLDVDMGFIPKLDDMSLGEYIDCENYIGEWQDMHKAMAVLYRPVNFKSKDKYTIAPYKPSEEIQELMKEMPLSVVMGSMVFFYRLGMELSKAMLNSGYNISSEDGFGEKWGWYQSIYTLAKGDVRRFDEVTELALHHCLTFLMFEKEKNELEAKMIKKQYKS